MRMGKNDNPPIASTSQCLYFAALMRGKNVVFGITSVPLGTQYSLICGECGFYSKTLLYCVVLKKIYIYIYIYNNEIRDTFTVK